MHKVQDDFDVTVNYSNSNLPVKRGRKTRNESIACDHDATKVFINHSKTFLNAYEFNHKINLKGFFLKFCPTKNAQRHLTFWYSNGNDKLKKFNGWSLEQRKLKNVLTEYNIVKFTTI